MFFRNLLLSCVLLVMQLCSMEVSAQKEHIKTVYFDRNYRRSVLNNASIKEVFYKLENYWQIDKYVKDTLTKQFYLNEERFLADTAKNPAWKKITFFYQNGKKKEYRHAEDTLTTYAEHYTENGQKDGAATFLKDSLINSQGWDDKGNLIPNFVYEKEAEYPGGGAGWKHHLYEALHPDVAMENGAPAGRNYTVVVSFLIDKDGNVTDIKADNNPGYGTAEEAVRVIAASQKWYPAIYMNKKVIYHQRQQITFQVLQDNNTAEFPKITYLDKSFKKTDSLNAVYKGIRKPLDDTSMEMKIYQIEKSALVQYVKQYRVADGTEKGFFKNYDLKGTLMAEGFLINNKLQKLIKFYPNGKKAEEVIYGNETNMPIKSTRWDETGKLIP